MRSSRRLSSILVQKPPSLAKAIRNSGGDEESDPQRRCRRANQEQSFARELVVLATTDKKEGQAKCGQRDAKLDAVEDATQGIFEIECQGFEIFAACIAFEEGDEILAAGESIQKFRVKLGDLLTPRLRRLFTAITQTDQPRTQAIVERMIVTARESGIRLHTFWAMRGPAAATKPTVGIRVIIISHLLLRRCAAGLSSEFSVSR